MKLHDPAVEKELLRIATKARDGKPMQNRDPGPGWFDRVSPWVTPVFLGIFLLFILGLGEPRARTWHWRGLVTSLVFMFTAFVGYGILTGSARQPALFNLPVAGRTLLEKVRKRFLLRSLLSVISFSAAGATALLDFSPEEIGKILASTLLLSTTTLATLILMGEPWLRKAKIPIGWGISALCAAITVALLGLFRRKLFYGGGIPDWLGDCIQLLTWIYPPSWALPGRMEQGGAVLAILWSAWGIRRWMSWPKDMAYQFDAPRDYYEAFGHFALEEDEEEEEIHALGRTYSTNGIQPPPLPEESDEAEFGHEPEPASATSKRRKPIPVSTPLELPDLPGDGWVDRWIRRCLGPADEKLAVIFGDPDRTFTRRTNRAAGFAAICLPVAWILMKFLPESHAKEVTATSIFFVSLALVLWHLFPFTNAIPRATAPWLFGEKASPLFSGLPVGVRDLLRVSGKITRARCGVMALIATPFLSLLAFITIQAPIGPSLFLVPVACGLWAISRPVFICYRIQESASRRRGTWFIHTVAIGLTLLLGLGWLLSAFAALVCCVGVWAEDAAGDRWEIALYGLAGFATSALCARGILEIRRLLLARRILNW